MAREQINSPEIVHTSFTPAARDVNNCGPHTKGHARRHGGQFYL